MAPENWENEEAADGAEGAVAVDAALAELTPGEGASEEAGLPVPAVGEDDGRAASTPDAAVAFGASAPLPKAAAVLTVAESGEAELFAFVDSGEAELPASAVAGDAGADGDADVVSAPDAATAPEDPEVASSLPEAAAAEPAENEDFRRRNAVLFAVVAILWLLIDISTKSYFNNFAVGEHIGGPYAGLFEFVLVHNTGAAWGMFGGSTFALGVVSLLVCALLLLYLFVLDKQATCLQAFALALVFAGGLGNAIDRFAQGYVVDFINFAFMSFPVFNVADIGVTCGFVLFILATLATWKKRPE